MGGYDHRTVEAKWIRRWQETRAFAADLDQAPRPYYNLMMFPYPSAAGLHVGNLFAFTGSDIHGRYRRARGDDVFEPFGFDAFGIHSENYALRTGRHPRDQVPANIAAYRKQMQRLGVRVDWSRQVDSTQPGYYRWTQWIFLKLFAAGLVYQKEAPVNWCPDCRTVLADEQAAGGACERCGAQVEQRVLRQWFARITAYAGRLLDNLEWIDWSEGVKTVQRQWIGRSGGAEVRFPVEGPGEPVSVFTTRPDTLWGVTFLVLAPEHPRARELTAPGRRSEVEEYLRAAASRSAAARQEEAGRARTGVFTGRHVTHPGTGERLPVWVAEYVLADYGTGAVMAVPAHDARDFAFAAAHGLPVVEVISPDGAGQASPAAYTGEGVMMRSGAFTGTRSAEGRERVGAWLAERGCGGPAVRYRLRDWCLSRQRYWGPPIPIVHCGACGAVPVPETELPVRLPDLEDYRPDGSGRSPLARCEGFANTACPRCGRAARRETDVSDNFLDSAWYYLRYPSTDREDVAFDRVRTRKWLPVDMYIGGREHAVLHLMYTRFVTMALHDLGLVDFEEPFRRFRAHGLILLDGAKMSKSGPRVVSPDGYAERYGADTLRTYLMFLGPFQQGGDFSDRGIAGVRRFYERLWRYATEAPLLQGEIGDREVLGLLHRQIGRATEAIEDLRYNGAVAALMELLNGLSGARQHYRAAAETLLQLAAPFAPFITQELWERLGRAGAIEAAPWPESDASLAQADTVEWVVQINGKIRDRMELPAGTAPEAAGQLAAGRERVRQWIAGKEEVRRVVVPERLVNIVVREA